jgi:hypothetical protein
MDTEQMIKNAENSEYEGRNYRKGGMVLLKFDTHDGVSVEIETQVWRNNRRVIRWSHSLAGRISRKQADAILAGERWQYVVRNRNI